MKGEKTHRADFLKNHPVFSRMTPRTFGFLASGEPVELHTLANNAGASVDIMTYGGIVTALRVPDRHGKIEDVVLGCDTPGAYLSRHPYFGAIVGRIAGRVCGGRILVEGREHRLPCNEGVNHLHGGHVGFDRRLWTAQPLPRTDGDASLRLRYRSPDGEEGYPGALDVAVTYTLTEDNAFMIESEASSDQVTPLALTHHSYFNLAGAGSGSVVDHVVQIHADSFVPTDDAFSLTGRRESVEGQGNDLRQPRRLGEVLPRLFKRHGDLYLLRPTAASQPAAPTLAARVIEPRSGRVMEVWTDESCLQFYTASELDIVGKTGCACGSHAGLCLECQGYPEATSQPGFGDILVRPGQAQRRRTVYAFSAS